MAGFNLGDIIVTIKANTDSLQKGLNEVQNMAQKTKDFGDKMSSALDASVDSSKKFAIGVAAAGAVVVGFGVMSLKAFSDSEDKIAQTNAVLKSTKGVAGETADAVTKLASALEKQTKFSDEDVRSVENLLLTFTGIGKDIFPQATKTVLDMATALGEDTSSASIQLGKALQDPILGVTALRRVGVNFSSAQKDVIKHLVETGKTAEAQKVILKELNTEFGGSAVAAGSTAAGGLAKLKNQFNNVQEAIGKLISDGIVPLGVKLMDWFESVGGVDGVMKRLGDTLNAIKPYFPTIIGFIIGGLVPAFLALGASIIAAIAPLVPFLLAGAALGFLWDKNKLLFFALAGAIAGFAIGIFVALLPGIIAATAAFATMAIAVIAATWPFILAGAAIAAIAFLIVSNWAGISKFFGEVAKNITNFFKPIVGFFVDTFNTIKNAFAAVGKFFADTGNNIANFFKQWGLTILAIIFWPFSIALGLIIMYWTPITEFFQGLWSDIVAVFRPVVDFFVTIFKLALAGVMLYWNFAIAFYTGIFNGIVAIFTPIIGFFANVFSGAWNIITGIFGGLYGFFAGVWGNITKLFGGVGTAIGNAIGGTVRGAVNTVLGFAVNAINTFIGAIDTAIDVINHIPGVHVGKISSLSIPKFSSGIENFAGGLAYVHGGEVLANLAPGTTVIPKSQVGGMGSKTVIIENVNIQNRQDADYLIQRINRNLQLESMGVSPVL